MSIYQTTLTIPKETPKTNPIVQKIQIAEDYIQLIRIRIPVGHRAFAGMHIRYGHDMFVPMPTKAVLPDGIEIKQKIEDLWLIGDNEIYEIPVHYSAPEVPFEVTIEGYNDSIRYPHSFIIQIIAVPKIIALPHIIFEKLVDIIRVLVMT